MRKLKFRVLVIESYFLILEINFFLELYIYNIKWRFELKVV